MNDQINTIEPMGVARVAHSRVDDLYSPEYFGGLSQLATAASKSRLFGDATPDQLFMILMTGKEMQLTPTVALRNIGVFKNKTVISSQLQMAKVKEAGYLVEITENTAERATVSVQRKGEKAYVKTFTITDATLAGLLARNELYRTNPATMLLNRAIGLACRYGAPEVLNGLHNADELIEVDAVTLPETTQPETTQEVKSISGATNTPMADTVVRGWTVEAQDKFAGLMDLLYTKFKDAGKIDKHADIAAKWRKNMTTDDATKVCTELEAFIGKLGKASKPALEGEVLPAVATGINPDDKLRRDAA